MSEFYEDEDIFQKERYPNFNLKEYLVDNDFEYRSYEADGHEELATNCPMCIERGETTADVKRKLWINAEEGKYFCYRCKWSGNLVWFIRKISNTNIEGAYKILRGTILDPLDHLSLKLFSEDVVWIEEDVELRPIDLPYGYRKLNESHEYMKGRKVPFEHAEKNDWGIGVAGFCKDRLIVPTFMEDQLVFWQARATWESDDKEFRKVLNPQGVSARKVLYNYDEAKSHEVIYITEGFMDCCKVGENAVATNGKNLHPEQVAWLEKTNAKTVILAWDYDSWTDGTKRKPSSIQKASDMLKMKFSVKAVKFPKGRDAGSYASNSPELKNILNKTIDL